MTRFQHAPIPSVSSPLVCTTKSRLLTGLRLVPAALLLAGALGTVPAVGATGVSVPAAGFVANADSGYAGTALYVNDRCDHPEECLIINTGEEPSDNNP